MVDLINPAKFHCNDMYNDFMEDVRIRLLLEFQKNVKIAYENCTNVIKQSEIIVDNQNFIKWIENHEHKKDIIIDWYSDILESFGEWEDVVLFSIEKNNGGSFSSQKIIKFTINVWRDGAGFCLREVVKNKVPNIFQKQHGIIGF